MYKNKGITMVSLVITIILLIILAGISIQALTNTGLFETAGQAKKEAKRAQVVEWLDLKLIEEQTYNPTGTAESIINGTKARIEKNKSELEAIGKTVNIEEPKTEEDGEQVDIYFYIQVDKDVFKVEVKGAQFIGEEGKFPPIIKLDSITDTTNSITVQVSTKRNEGGKIEYYIKSEDEQKYTLKETTTDESYTFTELEQNKKYNIKIVAVAENKLTAEVLADRELGSVPDLVEADITFTYSIDGKEINKETWTNKAVTVTVTTTVEGYTLQTSKDGETWSNLKSQTFSENGDIYVVLFDGKNYGGAATGSIRNIDKQKPVANITDTKTNSITFTGTDAANDGESASGIAAYIVQESSTAPDENDTRWTSYDGTSKTVSGLIQGTTYFVFVKDNAGNVSEAASDGTENVTDLTKADIDFTYTPSGWTNGSVKVTAALSNNKTSSYTLRITDTDPTTANKQTILGWKTGSEGITVDSNKAVYAVLVDEEGQIGAAASGNVDKIDTQIPVASVSSTTTNSITFTGSDTAKTGESASGIAAYIVQESSTAPDENDTRWTSYDGTSKTVSGLTQGKTYYVFVKDKAGNVSAAASKGTGTVTNLTSANITFTYSPSSWTNGSVKVTAALKDMTSSYTLKITDSNPVGANKSTALGWTNASTGITVSTNKAVYAVLVDNEGQIGTAATGNVDKIDTVAPTISTALSSTSKGINSVTLSVGITDTKSGLGKIEWYYGTTNNPTTLADTTKVTDLNGSEAGPTTPQTKSYTVTGLTPGTTYWFKVIAYDVAGKTATSTVISVTTDNPTAADISHTPSDTSWNVNNVKSALDYLYNR